MTAPEAVDNRKCEQTFQLARPPDRFQAFLTCDLTRYGHAGLNHHDPVFGVWWSRCDLGDQFAQHPHRHQEQP